MQKLYRLVFESYDPTNENELTKTVITKGIISNPVDLFSIGFSHEEQIAIIKSSQDALIKEQFQQKTSGIEYCKECPNQKLIKSGKNKSKYHDVFTDHDISITRRHCPNCKHEESSTVRAIFGSTISSELAKIQAELGADCSYRDSEQIFAKFSYGKRDINNHDRIKQTSELIGAQVQELHNSENELTMIKPALELIINVDGGHINTTEPNKRSFEALAAVVYKPEALSSNESGTRNIITSKHCAVSTQNDNQQQMIANTIVAALKQGLSPHTNITALCDGAKNCWNIIDAFKPIVASVTCILDWFHLSMKIHNISLPSDLKPKLESVKWCLWHGKVEDASSKLGELIWDCPEKHKLSLEKLNTYIKNNSDKIVNYDERNSNGLVYTSNLAESTVESLINQRCKGQQHMRWTRAGLDPILQLRAAISSNEWPKIWKMAVTNSIAIH
jgi:hypothetical protein